LQVLGVRSTKECHFGHREFRAQARTNPGAAYSPPSTDCVSAFIHFPSTS
jgi:hypothetical protein